MIWLERLNLFITFSFNKESKSKKTSRWCSRVPWSGAYPRIEAVLASVHLEISKMIVHIRSGDSWAIPNAGLYPFRTCECCANFDRNLLSRLIFWFIFFELLLVFYLTAKHEIPSFCFLQNDGKYFTSIYYTDIHSYNFQKKYIFLLNKLHLESPNSNIYCIYIYWPNS